MSEIVELIAQIKAIGVKEAEQELRAFAKSADAAKGSVSGADKATSNFGARASVAGGKLTRGLTLPILAAGTAALHSALNFETSMSQIVGLVGAPADEVERLKGKVLDLAGVTAQAPGELADALFAVMSAGFEGGAAMDVLTLSAKAAAAGLGDTKTVALAVGASVNAYGQESLSAAMATDIMVATVKAGNLAAEDLAGALGKILPIASAAKVELADVGGATAILTRSGSTAGEAITQLKAAIMAMNAPNKAAQASLEAVGLTSADLQSTLADDGLIAAFEMVEEATNGDAVAMKEFFGSSEALSAALTLLNGDADVIAGVMDDVANSTGLAGEAFDVAAGTDAFAMKQAFAELQAAAVDFGTEIAPAIATVAGAVGELAAAFSALPDWATTIVVGGVAAAAAAGPVLKLAGNVSQMATKMKGAGGAAGKMVKMLGAMNPALLGVGAAVGVGLVVWQQWNERKKKAAELARDFADALTDDTGALETNSAAVIANVEAMIVKSLEEKNQLDDLARAGISIDEVTAAIMGQEGATEALTTKLMESGEANLGLLQNLGQLTAGYEDGTQRAADKAQVLGTLSVATIAAEADILGLQTGLDIYGRAVATAGATTEVAAADVGDFGSTVDSTGTKVNTLGDALSDLDAAFNKIIGVNLSAEEALSRYEAQLDDVVLAVMESGNSLDITTEAGRNNRKTVRDMITASQDHAAAVGEQTGSIEEANSAFAKNIEQMVDTMQQAGFTDAQINDLARTYGLIPDNLATDITEDSVTARANLERVLNLQDRIDGRTTSSTHNAIVNNIERTFTQPGGRQFRRDGGPVHGPRGAPVDITAHGGEFVLSADIVDAVKAGKPTIGLPALAPGSVSNGGGDTYINVVVQAGLGTDGRQVAGQIIDIVQDHESSNSKVFSNANPIALF